MIVCIQSMHKTMHKIHIHTPHRSSNAKHSLVPVEWITPNKHTDLELGGIFLLLLDIIHVFCACYRYVRSKFANGRLATDSQSISMITLH